MVLDAMSLIHRAYHAVPRHFATSSGEPTNAVYGFTNILLRVVDDLSPDHAAAAFDLPGPTFRDEIYEPYKAHREAPDDALIAQFGRIRELVEVLGIPIYELESYEADDMLGTLARQAEAEGFDVWLVTGDRDALQLVTPHVRVLSTNPRTGQPLIYDEAAIVDRWGIRPSQVVDFKGLVGDSSDNIPGVKGVGEKTASTLLRDYADIDDIYAHLEDIRPAFRRRLEGQEEVAELSRELATIVCDVPVAFDAERTRLWQADVEAVQALMRELQFRNVAERMGFLQTSAQVEDDELEVEPVLVQDAEDAQALAEQLAGAARVAVFPYVRGASWSAELLGLGLAWGGETAYVSLDGEAGPLDELRAWLEDAQAAKAAFDSKALHHALATRGVSLRGVEADLLLAAYVATPSAIPRTLDDLAFRRRGVEVEPALPDAQAAGGLMRPDPEAAAVPAALRAALALALADEMDAEIDDLKLTELLHDVEMPLALVLSDMEGRGIKLDAGALGDLSREMAEEIAELQSGIYADAGHEFNVNSPKQLGTVLFEELGLPAGRRTKTGLFDGERGAGRAGGRKPDRGTGAGIPGVEQAEVHLHRHAAGPGASDDGAAAYDVQPGGHGDGASVVGESEPAEHSDPNGAGAGDPAGVRGGALGLDAAGHRLLPDRPAGAGAHQRGHGDVPGVRERARHPRGHGGQPARGGAGRGDRGHAAAGEDDELRDRVWDQRAGTGVADRVFAAGGRQVHRDVLRDLPGRQGVHGFDHRASARAGLRGNAVPAAALPAGVAFAGLPRAGGGRADGDQHADPGDDGRHQ